MMSSINKLFILSVVSGVATSAVLWAVVGMLIFMIPYDYAMWITIIYFMVPVIGGGIVGGFISSSNKALSGLLIGLISYGIYHLFTEQRSFGAEIQQSLTTLIFVLFGGLLGFLGTLISYGRFKPVLLSILVIGSAIAIFSSMFVSTDLGNHNLFDKGYSSTDTGFMSDFKKALNDSDFDFNIYSRDGNEFVGYRSEDEADIEKLIKRVEEERHVRIHGRPKDYVEYCTYGGSLSSVIESLKSENIDYHMVNADCIAWPRYANDLLHEINPQLKALKDAETRYEHERGKLD